MNDRILNSDTPNEHYAMQKTEERTSCAPPRRCALRSAQLGRVVLKLPARSVAGLRFERGACIYFHTFERFKCSNFDEHFYLEFFNDICVSVLMLVTATLRYTRMRLRKA